MGAGGSVSYVQPELRVNLSTHFAMAEAAKIERERQKSQLLKQVPSIIDYAMTGAVSGGMSSLHNETTIGVIFENQDSNLATDEELLRFVQDLFNLYAICVPRSDGEPLALDMHRFMILIRKVLEVYKVQGKRLADSSIQDLVQSTERNLLQRMAENDEQRLRKSEVSAFVLALFRNLSRMPLLWVPVAAVAALD